ncbi:hypothetical protein EYC80_005066 [Monilinia laxa]|uniref:Uncharacterized protein n=1 Tax=Monilinia laxa TaxID=61186 RepID=A0A5N6KIS2_MONLA|nr:hypothetical protein EYC80_005066 [Monilinia laxa]
MRISMLSTLLTYMRLERLLDMRSQLCKENVMWYQPSESLEMLVLLPWPYPQRRRSKTRGNIDKNKTKW